MRDGLGMHVMLYGGFRLRNINDEIASLRETQWLELRSIKGICVIPLFGAVDLRQDPEAQGETLILRRASRSQRPSPRERVRRAIVPP